MISDSWLAGFKNEDNIKPGHRNIYLNGGENHPYCKPWGWKNEAICRHYMPFELLTFLNNNAGGESPKKCSVAYVCPEKFTADDLAPFDENVDKTKVIA